ncbi:hypothetical protein SFR_0385 [Streptomyces sp. FR-008]|nr:hypothetical protein SFR_0385 [Streptomyces sp. FR-008]
MVRAGRLGHRKLQLRTGLLGVTGVQRAHHP